MLKNAKTTLLLPKTDVVWYYTMSVWAEPMSFMLFLAIGYYYITSVLGRTDVV